MYLQNTMFSIWDSAIVKKYTTCQRNNKKLYLHTHSYAECTWKQVPSSSSTIIVFKQAHDKPEKQVTCSWRVTAVSQCKQTPSNTPGTTVHPGPAASSHETSSLRQSQHRLANEELHTVLITARRAEQWQSSVLLYSHVAFNRPLTSR